jgi:hypothetical protein
LPPIWFLSLPPWFISLFVWLVADGWCWFVLREKYCWLIVDGWFVLREKYCWLVDDKPNEQGVCLRCLYFCLLASNCPLFLLVRSTTPRSSHGTNWDED